MSLHLSSHILFTISNFIFSNIWIKTASIKFVKILHILKLAESSTVCVSVSYLSLKKPSPQGLLVYYLKLFLDMKGSFALRIQ